MKKSPPSDKLNQNRDKLIWIGIFLLAVFFRFYLLHSLPAYLVRDELFYQVEAQSILQTGQNVLGNWSPWSLTSSDQIYSELSSTILVPAQLLTFLPVLLQAKITHALIGVVLVFIIAGISYQLFRKQEIAMIAALFAIFNPWLFQFSRMGFESFFSLFFYSLGALIFLATPIKFKLISVLFFFIGFYQYQGLKVLLVPFTVLLVIYELLKDQRATESWLSCLKRNIRPKWTVILLVAFALVLTGYFALNLPNQRASGRTGVISIFASDTIAHLVDEERRKALPSPIDDLVINKFTTIMGSLIAGYSLSFNATYWFIAPISNPDFWSVNTVGKLYLIDVVFLFFAIVAVVSVRKQQWTLGGLFLLGWVLVGALTQAFLLNDNWPTFRTALMVPALVIGSALGAHYLWSTHRTVSKWLLLPIWVVGVFFFIYAYFFKFPILSTFSEDFYYRVMAEYTRRLDAINQPVTIVTKSIDYPLEKLIFYNRLISASNLQLLRTRASQSSTFSIANVTLIDSCLAQDHFTSKHTLISAPTTNICLTDETFVRMQPNIVIASLLDSGTMFTIYNDSLCSQYSLQPYMNVKSRIFDLESLSDKDFCTHFFVRYDSVEQ